jgi:AraC-like DNA-binding protein
MKSFYKEPVTGGELLLTEKETQFDRFFFTRDRQNKYLTIAWNLGSAQEVVIDEVLYTFPANTLLPLVTSQSFRFEQPDQIVAWQFNREFYCIMDNDKAVSCVGFIFLGSTETMFIRLDDKEHHNFTRLLEVFKDELENKDDIQGSMLRMLLVRLIIKLTRLARKQYLNPSLLEDNKMDIVRQYNLLVENHYRVQHQVQFYAQELNKSPKTLSNLFSLYNHKSPLQVIQDRITQEAKRLFHYTDKSAKEISGELGFEDAAHFSRFFKNQTGISPSEFKKSFQARA